ncbi:MAG: STAS domain-containing protein [Pseudomonadota bacterium]
MSQTETTIDLPRRADLSTAGPLRDAFLAAKGDVHLRAGAVEVLNSPVLQVLLSARRTLEAADRRVVLVAASRAFDDCLALLGASREHVCSVDRTEVPA